MSKKKKKSKWDKMTTLQRLFHFHTWKADNCDTMYSTARKCITCGKREVDHDVYC